MKKLYYLIPIILTILNVLPFSIYKDAVIQNNNGSLSPSHWKIASESISASLNLSGLNLTSNSTPSQNSKPPLFLVSTKANFKGFPFGAYFNNNLSSNNSGTTSNITISAYSILWIISDGLIILIALLLSFLLNRSKKSEDITYQNPQTPYDSTVNSVQVTPPQTSIIAEPYLNQNLAVDNNTSETIQHSMEVQQSLNSSELIQPQIILPDQDANEAPQTSNDAL